jgi:predicted phosphodiesterase
VPINIAIEIFKKQKINTLIINGDLLDNTPFTKHDGKRPTPGQVREWFDMTEAFLEFLRSTFPKVDIYWLEGNHDFWYKRWMQKNAEQLDEDPYFSLQSRLHIQDYNIIFLPQETYMKAGKLNILHGHQLSGRFGVGVSPARSIYLKTKKSTLIGHVHVEDSYTDNDIDRTTTTCWSTGCLCTLTPDYNPIGGKACHGFAHVIIESTGDFSVKNYRISKGKLL